MIPLKPFPKAAHLLVSLLALALISGCASHPDRRPLPTAAKVDLRRYSGKWHEIARLKNRFQREGESAVAEYTPLDASTVAVRNTALAPSGKTRSIDGKAEVVPGSNGARLRVRFEGFAALAPVSREGNYWIIALDPNYRSAMVGTPDRKYLWILSRTPHLDPATTKAYLDRARKLGFPMDQLVWDSGKPGGR